VNEEGQGPLGGYRAKRRQKEKDAAAVTCVLFVISVDTRSSDYCVTYSGPQSTVIP